MGIDKDAELSTIKKAYRRLSLEKHPDKNPDDKLAVSEFIQITKAYAVRQNQMLNMALWSHDCCFIGFDR